MVTYTFAASAIEAAKKWHGRCSVVPCRRPCGDYGYVIMGGHHTHAVYVTLGMRYADWERDATI